MNGPLVDFAMLVWNGGNEAEVRRQLQDCHAENIDEIIREVRQRTETRALSANQVEVEAEEPGSGSEADIATPISFFESIALPLAARGWKVAPCYPKDKKIHTRLVPDPLVMISNDPAQIHAWSLSEPDANVALYAEQVEGGMLFLDKDGAINLREKYERETGKKFPQTLLVLSSIVRDANGDITNLKGHWYFTHSLRTLALAGNISEKKTGGLFSLRLHNEYVASIGSIHPKTQLPYEIYEDFPVLPMPDDLLDWLLKQVVDDAVSRADQALIPHGQIHPALVSQAGKLHSMGYEVEDVEPMLLTWAHKFCAEPLDDAKIIAVAQSVCKNYPTGSYTDLALTQTRQQATTATIETKPTKRYKLTPEEFEIEIEKDYPVIPLVEQAGPSWDDDIMYGVCGDIIRKAGEYCEAHPAGMYLDLLVAVGSIIGGAPYFNITKTRHHTNEFMVRVGSTSDSRKGTGRDVVDDILKMVDLKWHQERIMSGFGSAEAIVNEIRDPRQQQIADKKTLTGFRTVTAPGVDDKRLCIREGEMASVFQLAGKKESRADIVLRDGWDSKPQRNLVKGKTRDGLSNSNCCMEPHISISGDTTVSELLRKMPDGSADNGFGNRFLYCYVYRTKLCPLGGPDIDWSQEIPRLYDAIQWAKTLSYVPLTKAANKIWTRMYGELDEPANKLPGLAGAMTARAAAHIRRLALIYCVLDERDMVDSKHLIAARKIWDYCSESAKFIFTGSTRDQDQIRGHLEQNGAMTKGEIRRQVFQDNRPSDWVHAQIDGLVRDRSSGVAIVGDKITIKRA